MSTVTTKFEPISGVKLRDWFKTMVIAFCTPVLRSKENLYPFIIATDESGVDHSLFLSKGLSEQIGETTPDVKSLGDYKVYETINAQGEKRLKLGRDGDNKIAVSEDFFD